MAASYASAASAPARKVATPAKVTSKSVKFSSSPVASTSKAPVAVVKEYDLEMLEKDDEEEEVAEAADEGEWHSKTTDDDVAENNRNGGGDEEDDAVMIDPQSLLPPSSSAKLDEAGTGAAASGNEQGLLAFPALSAKEMQGKVETQTRKVTIPPHRMTPLKRDWPKIYSPLVDECGLMVRMNVPKKSVEMKTSKHTPAPSSTILQRAVDFVTAYGLGFSAEDAVALLRMEDLFVESFEVRDVKTLSGDHLSRAIGRIAGKDGKTRFTIENASKTRIVLADQKIHILGTFQSIKIARDAVCSLILGSPPGKVFNGLRTVAARQRGRF